MCPDGETSHREGSGLREERVLQGRIELIRVDATDDGLSVQADEALQKQPATVGAPGTRKRRIEKRHRRTRSTDTQLAAYLCETEPERRGL